jgi:Xaa-Pro dipeptidase
MSDRREFLKISAGVVGATMISRVAASGGQESQDPIRKLRPMTDGIVKITDDERKARIEKARQVMADRGIRAIVVEPGPSMFYFTDVRWWASERLFAFVLPAEGPLAWICPKFEEDRAREIIRFGDDIRVWEEDESPYALVRQVFVDRGIRAGQIGIEEKVRFFVADGIRKECSGVEFVTADPVTVGCRVIKSPAELALMQKANDITIVAYRAAVATLKEGMTPSEFSANCSSAFRALGASGGADANFGKASAFPHGSLQPQKLREGDIVLMDGGCSIQGYQSDISRTVVFGKPSQRQRTIWDLARKAQDAALAAARVGAACEDVDSAARKVIVDGGFGPGYKVPGLPHRTGHGIGLEGHEWTNLVKGNKTPLRPGMCFSDEPMISIPGEFGVRHEDCMYITEEGGKLFTKPSLSIDQPFG